MKEKIRYLSKSILRELQMDPIILLQKILIIVARGLFIGNTVKQPLKAVGHHEIIIKQV